MATQEHTQEDSETRIELARQANFEISKLAEAASNLSNVGDDDYQILHGILARIQTLSDIVFYAARLHGDSDDAFSMQKLQNAFKGSIV